MNFETKAMEKNPVVKTAKWALSMMNNKIVISVSMLVSGVIYMVAPGGNMNGTVVTIAIVLIAAALINIGIHLIPRERTGSDFFLSFVNLLLVGFGVFCLISPSAIEPVVRYIFAVITIITNLVNMIEIFKLEEKRSWKFFVGLFVAIIMIGLGVAMIIAGETVIASMQQGIGIFLVIDALINIWYIVRLGMEARSARKAAKQL